MVKFVESRAELEQIIAANAKIVIDFTAAWCGPCKAIAPEFERLAKANPHTLFLKVDVDAASEIAAKFKISAMPTFIGVKGGGEIARIQGADRAALAELVQLVGA